MRHYLTISSLFSLLVFEASTAAAQWHWQHPLPQGNGMNKVQFVNERMGWISSDAGVMLKTTDGGETWTVKQLPERIYGQALFFVDSLVGWVGGRAAAGVHALLYRTTDGGDTWTERFSLSQGDFRSIEFVDRNFGWAAGQSGNIHRTTDAGNNWTTMSLPLGTIHSLSFVDSLTGWGAAGYRRIHTIDGGKTWLLDTLLSPIRDIVFLDTLRGWECGFRKINYTTDGGVTWLASLDTLQTEWYDLFVLDNARLFATGWDQLLGEFIARSTDQGGSWTLQPSPAGKIADAIAFLDTLTGVAVGFSEGPTLIRTTDGGVSWFNFLRSVTTQPLFGIHFFDTINGWISGWNGTILNTTNGGITWDSIRTDNTERLFDVEFIDLMSGWTVGTNATILRTTNAGVSWIQQPSPVFSTTLLDIETSQHPLCWIIGGGLLQPGRLLRSVDGGESWHEMTAVSLPSSTQQIQFTSSTTGWIMAGSANGGSVQATLKTSNGGLNWQYVLTNSSDTTFLSMSFINDEIGWVSTFASSIYHTSDGGSTWRMNQTPDLFYSICFVDAQQGWAGSFAGEIYRTTDAGETWVPQHSPLDGPVSQLLMNDANHGWAVGSFGRVMHTTNGGVTGIDADERKDAIPSVIVLHQNFPNPFNAQTTIRFELTTHAQKVALRVIDLLGREVNLFTVPAETPGVYSLNWDGMSKSGQTVASGVYIYSIQADRNSVQRKLVFIK